MPCVMTPSAAQACDLPPPALQGLDVPRFYADRTGTVEDPVLKALQVRGTAPVRAWLSHVTREADSSLRRASPSLGAYKARCAVEWLEAWAARDALLGTMATKQAEAERRWTLAGAALAYLKVRAHAEPHQQDTIERWLRRLSARAAAAFQASGAKPNNHLYWLGLGLAATAVATEDRARWAEARTILDQGAAAVQADGTLPLELARGRRALHYHVFAAMPLVSLAYLAQVHGETLPRRTMDALDRLVARTVAGLQDPDDFGRRAGVPQEAPVRAGAGWLQLYERLTRTPLVIPAPETPAGHRWLGGNVLLLAKALEPAAP